MKKVFLPGLVAGLAMLAVGMVLNFLFKWLSPSLAAEYVNANLFRPWSDPLMSLFFLSPFITGWILAWIWDKLKDVKMCLSDKCKCNGNSCLAIAYWVISLPGMLMTYSSFKISLLMVLSWVLCMLAQYMVAIWILAKMNKKN